MERSLHSLIPPMAAAILTYHSLRLLVDSWGIDKVAILAPHLFAFLMTLGMISLGCRRSSYDVTTDNPNPRYAISSPIAKIHSILLLLMPGTMHVLNFRRRIFSQYASLDMAFDLILVWVVPYLLHCCILLLVEKSPYEMRNQLFPSRGQKTLQGTAVPVGASILASLAIQQRYLLPLCHAMSYRFHGHSSAPTWVLSIYLTVSTISALFAMWTWERQSTVTNEPLFGEYHEDVVQLSICVCGLLAGKAFGMPWNLTPLPTLAFLGLSIWFSTKMLRYLCIFLFVVYATGVVLFTYRFASIDLTVPLVVPGVELGLVRFGELEVFASLFVGLLVGFAVRPTGGEGADILKKIDVPGICFILYVLLLDVLELTLLKRPAPLDYVGQESVEGTDGNGYLYDHTTVFITSIAAAGISSLLRRTTVISKKSSVIVVSIAIGKAVAAFIDMNEQDSKVRNEVQQKALAHRAFYRSICASILCIVMLAPRAFLSRIYIKSSSRYKRSISDGRQLGSVPKRAFQFVVVYSLVVLPLALVSSVPMVLTPVTMVVSSHYEGGAYYAMAPPVSEMFGFAVALWGMACFSTLNHYFPEGGCETWKKVAALAILMGAGIAASAPSVPEWLGGDSGFGVSNPYASISSLGSRIVKQRRSRTGGWGILLASLATLLAITGPLELRERRHPSGRKDKKLLFRMMVFSIMFGSGVSWFITIQCMGEARPFIMIVTGVCSMVVAFFGTVTCVLGYFLELEGFDEVEQMITISFGSFFIFGIVAGVPSFVLSSSAGHPFGAEGWLSAYLSVSCVVSLALSSMLRMRQTKDQNSRGLGNLSCIFAYLLATVLIYGRFGVAGVDHVLDVRALYGIPAPVLGTFFISPIMLLLEGETSNERRSRVSRISGTNAKPANKTIGINFPNLTRSNQFVPPLVASIFVFLAASLYTIFFRGFFSLGGTEKSSEETLATAGTLISMAQRTISHNKAMAFASRLGNASLWTSTTMMGPIMHISGLVATIPSLYLLVSGMWYASNVPKAQVTLFLPFNLVPVFFCTGTPTLRAVGVICLVGGILQITELSKQGHRSQMRM
eukprot:CAMPEP_0113661046 /NCGR_PEP_ID=MMETSP0017_2-20120614/33222_1 /TAXON_ID=2856 /ORGANISM="Cylindrotheca closterium" /LENGTH=1070 /DNA_ID=CAMNT_0000575717 /DNA_START=51 /DNA_END=3263 /DNA_ORIENTATION=- /assembly_acc=CAM_ASM_000147